MIHQGPAPEGLRISPSSRKTFISCPRKWYFTKVLKVEEGPKDHLILGSAVHSLCERYILTGVHPSDNPREMTDTSSDNTSEYSKGDLDKLAADAAKVCGYGTFMLEDYRALKAVEPLMVLVEARLAGHCGPLPYLGYTDLGVQGPGQPEISDQKTSSNTASDWVHHLPEQVAQDPQLLFYCYALFYATLRMSGPVTVGHNYFPTKGGASKARQIKGTATEEDILANWAAFEQSAYDMLHTACINDVANVPANRAACSQYGGCPFKKLCPRGTVYKPSQTNKNANAGVNVSNVLAAMRAKKAARAAAAAEAAAPPAPTPTPPPVVAVPRLTDGEQEALMEKVVDYQERGALNDALLDALFIQFAADPQTVEEVREAVAILTEEDDGTGKVNNPDSIPAPVGVVDTAKQKADTIRVTVGNLAARITEGGQITQKTLDLFTDGKGLDADDIAGIIVTIAEQFPDHAPSALGPVFLPPVADGATPEERFLHDWAAAGFVDIDLSRPMFRTMVKEAMGRERYTNKAAKDLMALLVVAGHLVADGDLFKSATRAGSATLLPPEPDPAPAAVVPTPEVVAPEPDPVPTPEVVAPTPAVEGTVFRDLPAVAALLGEAEAVAAAPTPGPCPAKAQRLLLVGCMAFGSIPLDVWLEQSGVLGIYAAVYEAGTVKELAKDYYFSTFGKGTTVVCDIIDQALTKGDIELPWAIHCDAGHTLVALLQAVLTKHGVTVVR